MDLLAHYAHVRGFFSAVCVPTRAQVFVSRNKLWAEHSQQIAQPNWRPAFCFRLISAPAYLMLTQKFKSYSVWLPNSSSVTKIQ